MGIDSGNRDVEESGKSNTFPGHSPGNVRKNERPGEGSSQFRKRRLEKTGAGIG